MTLAVYRVLLIDGIILLLFFVLAFLGLTLSGRALWASLRIQESLVARLAAAVVLAGLGAGGLAIMTTFVLLSLTPQPAIDLTAVDLARTQTIVGLLLGLALAAAAVTRIEIYHRQAIGVEPKEEDEEAEWRVEGSTRQRVP